MTEDSTLEYGRPDNDACFWDAGISLGLIGETVADYRSRIAGRSDLWELIHKWLLLIAVNDDPLMAYLESQGIMRGGEYATDIPMEKFMDAIEYLEFNQSHITKFDKKTYLVFGKDPDFSYRNRKKLFSNIRSIGRLFYFYSEIATELFRSNLADYHICTLDSAIEKLDQAQRNLESGIGYKTPLILVLETINILNKAEKSLTDILRELSNYSAFCPKTNKLKPIIDTRPVINKLWEQFAEIQNTIRESAQYRDAVRWAAEALTPFFKDKKPTDLTKKLRTEWNMINLAHATYLELSVAEATKTESRAEPGNLWAMVAHDKYRDNLDRLCTALASFEHRINFGQPVDIRHIKNLGELGHILQHMENAPISRQTLIRYETATGKLGIQTAQLQHQK